MKISNPRSGWYFPRDWLAILAINFAPILVLLVVAMLLPPLLNTAHGDPSFLLEAMAIGCVGVVLLFIALGMAGVRWGADTREARDD